MTVGAGGTFGDRPTKEAAGAPTHDERVERAFAEAIGVPEPERGAMLDRLCGDDPRVRAEVESLLGHAQRTSEFLESPLLPGVAAMEVPLPERIGHFKVVSVLGEGGMGRVYEAEQERPRRRVAIKVVRSETLTPGALRRFEREIQTLGQLRHPCIAQLYEVGQDASVPGRPAPYLAMELVRGVSLTNAVRERGLAPRDRIELLARIADAVQYAHQRGVVHRDLKPENVLVEQVSEDGERGGLSPKILDFGIARLMDATDNAQTLAGGPMGTLAYMAPEQFSPDPAAIDTRCDVYALGVIAYELFAGARPIDVTGLSVAQAARLIESQDPPRLGSINPAWRGDIETIVAKAMSRDREARYASAAAMAEDLRRYLRDEPILARPPSAAYQIAKFARRNRVLVTVAAAGLLALVAGLVASTTLYLREQQARKNAAAAAALSDGVRDYLIQGLLLSAAPSRMGYDVKVVDVLTKASEGLHERFQDHPEVEAQVRADLGSVLDELGKYKESAEQFREALRLHTLTIGPHAEQTIRDLNGLVSALLGQEKLEEGLSLAQAGMQQARQGGLDRSAASISLRGNLGCALHKLGRYDESMLVLNEALALASQSPAYLSRPLAAVLSQLAACEGARGNKQASLAYTRRLLEHSRTYDMGDLRVIATSNLINALLEVGEQAEAVKLAEGLPADADRVFPPGHRYRAYTYNTAAQALISAREPQKAEPYAVQAYEILAALNEVEWDTERAAITLRGVYETWPGHQEQLLHWSLVGLKLRMMVGNREELSSTLETLVKLTNRCLRGKVNLQGVGLQEFLWRRRDELVPPGHPRRAVFYANYALICDAVDPCPHAAEALATAEEALSYVREDERAKALELIALARRRIVQGDRPGGPPPSTPAHGGKTDR